MSDWPQVEGVKVIMAQMRQILSRNGDLDTARVVVMGDMNVDTNHRALLSFSDKQAWGARPFLLPRLLLYGGLRRDWGRWGSL
jgi:hypothetical protein